MTAAGTKPKFDSAEYRPPMLGTPKKMCRNLSFLRHVLHLRLRIGDGDEPVSRFLLANGFLYAREKILLVDVGFERSAGLAGDDKQRVL